MSVAQNGSVIKRKSEWKNLQLIYRPTIRHYRRRLIQNNPRVNLDFHRFKTSTDHSIAVQSQGASAKTSPTKLDMDPPSRYKVSSASLRFTRQPLENWRVLDKTSLLSSSVSLVDMMDRSLVDIPRSIEDSDELMDDNKQYKPINNKKRCGVFLGLLSLSLLLIVPIVSVTLYQFVTCFERNNKLNLGKRMKLERFCQI